MPFFRIFQHLLPRAQAWRLAAGSTIRQFFEGLSSAPGDARDFVDEVYQDLFPATTRELAEWERQFGVTAAGTDDDRRATLAGEWSAQGGQSPSYIQTVLQTAGFDVYVHEWWDGTVPRVARDPRDYTTRPRIGSVQCVIDTVPADPPNCTPSGGEFDAVQPQCNAFLANEPKYIVNLNLTKTAPPLIPDDSDTWPHFVYLGGAVFGEYAVVDSARRAEFERLARKICPAHCWIVTLVLYEDDYVSDLFYFGGGDGWGDGLWS